jgi:hypothetical protein
MRLPKRFACGIALLAPLLFLAAARTSRAQNPPATSSRSPAAQSLPPAAGQSTGSSTDQPSAPGDIPATSPTAVSHGIHSVTVTFDYDFRQTPACTKKVTTRCVQQFIAYDISAGLKNATILFPIPLPAHPNGAVHGITATSPKLDFESGKHLISVSAMMPNGTHSKRSLCTTWITIP